MHEFANILLSHWLWFRVMRFVALWVVTPCDVIGDYQRFGETCCFHLQGISEDGVNTFYRNVHNELQGVTTQTAIITFAAAEGSCSCSGSFWFSEVWSVVSLRRCINFRSVHDVVYQLTNTISVLKWPEVFLGCFPKYGIARNQYWNTWSARWHTYINADKYTSDPRSLCVPSQKIRLRNVTRWGHIF
jgi:hypothetical protein